MSTFFLESTLPLGCLLVFCLASFLATIFSSQLPWHQIGNRQCVWFGDEDYQYGSITHSRSNEWHPIALSLLKCVNHILGLQLNSVLCTRYPDGTYHIPYHSDDEAVLGFSPDIVSLSLWVDHGCSISNKRALGTSLQSS